MSTAELRDQAKQMIETLPAGRLKLAASFLESLGAKPGKRTPAKVASMQRRIRKAERDVAAGRTIDWRKVRADV